VKGGAIFGRESKLFNRLRRHFPTRAPRERAFSGRGGAERRDAFDRLKVRPEHGRQGGERRLVETARRLSERIYWRCKFYGTEHLIVSAAT